MAHCENKTLLLETAGSARGQYSQPTEQERRKALQVTYRARKRLKTSNRHVTMQEDNEEALRNIAIPSASTFPAPVVVPGDELYYDPDCPPQSLQEWTDEEERNKVTRGRKTLYVVAPPSVSYDVGFVEDWTTPNQLPNDRATTRLTPPKIPRRAQQPKIGDVLEYLQAFYHGLEVKVLRAPQLEFTAWELEEGSQKETTKHLRTKMPSYVGLSTTREKFGIRCRRSKDGLFTGQLNLDDLLDLAISIVPKSAYALIMLLHQDLYESDDDEFCCGRAYGGSRVAVISTARYRPELDCTQGVDLEHVWPASHCSSYIGTLLKSKPSMRLSKAQNKTALEHPRISAASAIVEAVRASNALPLPSSPSELSALWLGRVCKTASHEVGHCFAIDHCTFYACIMQGAAHIAEDYRQPPYLCPVDLEKLLQAVQAGLGQAIPAGKKYRYEALLRFCEKWSDDRMFAAFGAWLRTRLSQLETA